MVETRPHTLKQNSACVIVTNTCQCSHQRGGVGDGLVTCHTLGHGLFPTPDGGCLPPVACLTLLYLYLSLPCLKLKICSITENYRLKQNRFQKQIQKEELSRSSLKVKLLLILHTVLVVLNFYFQRQTSEGRTKQIWCTFMSSLKEKLLFILHSLLVLLYFDP